MNTFENYPDWALEKWQEITDLLAEIIDVPATLIMKAENEFLEVFVSSNSEDNPYIIGTKNECFNHYCEEVLKSQNKVVITNALKEERWDKNPDLKLGMIAYLGFPVNYPDGKPFGTICVLDRIERDFTKQNEKLLMQFKNVIELHLALLQAFELNTSQLAAAVVQKATDCKRTEEEIRKLNAELEQRVAERTIQLEATNKELEGFAYSVSHDLRAPLRHINSFVDMLQDRIQAMLDNQSKHYMEVITDSTQKMGQLIDDLLLYSRSGRNEISKSKVNLNTLVHNIIQEFKPETEGRNIHWKIAPLPEIVADEVMLNTTLKNLISNALKFTRSRKLAEIEIGYDTSNQNEVSFFVRDNGIGFDMNFADKLFGVFQRLHSSDEYEGTGIGLANVRRIINRHGGRTWAEGKVEGGATFYFSLPKTSIVITNKTELVAELQY